MKAQIVDSVVRRGAASLAALAFAFVASPAAHATSYAYNTVSITTASSCELAGAGAAFTGSWNCSAAQQFTTQAGGYNFIMAPGSTTSPSYFGPMTLGQLPGANGPGGTNAAYLVLDSDFNLANSNKSGIAAQVDVNGLTIGTFYTVNFSVADGQQTGYPGPSHDQVQVCFVGSGCQTTTDVIDPGTGTTTPWVNWSFNFQATGNDQLLTLLGIGGAYPNNDSNVPAFALVDNLNITPTPPAPEPSSLVLLGTGLAGLGGLVRSRFTKRG